VSDKSTRKAPDYAVESRAARNRSVFDRNCSIGLAIPLRSGKIQVNRCRKRRFRLTPCGSERQGEGVCTRTFSQLYFWRSAPCS
jgi:hypothetical protein